MTKLISRNPATGEIIDEFESTPVSDLDGIFKQARQAQAIWGALPAKKRARHLLLLRETLLNNADSLIDLISAENGKPRYEALANEVIPAADMLGYFAKCAPKTLRRKSVPMNLMKHRRSYLQYWPVGVVLVISPWNYPFLLPFVDIIMALVAGNAVVFKPSEITPSVGAKILDLCSEAGFPPRLLQVVQGDGTLGAALVQQKPGKIFFTGSVAVGKKIMAAAAEHLIPVNLELGGKDPMIVLPDADLDYASSAALWGSFANSGQACASTERIIVHERIAKEFTEKLKQKVALLRPRSASEVSYDLGPITLEKQKAVYSKHLDEAKQANAEIVTGGEFSQDRKALQPTIVSGPGIEALQIYKEETFGPVVAITTFKSIDEAIQKANDTKYGLLASVITKNQSLAREIAKRLEVGTVTINEVLYTAGLGETPWGGVKDSGMGRTHSATGLYEFVNVRHIHEARSSLFVFKSLWWFPYTPYQYTTFRFFLDVFRRSWTAKLSSFSHFLWNFIKFIKEEKRF